jgi:hypothetical protein
MLSLDIMEGKEAQRSKKFHDLNLGEGNAAILHLCEYWFGSGRVIHGDSVFSSTPIFQFMHSLLQRRMQRRTTKTNRPENATLT